MTASTYFHHASLAELGQDDIFSIMFYGGGVTLILFAGLMVIMLWEFRGVEKDPNAPLLTSIASAIGFSIFISIIFLIAAVMFLAAYISVFSDNYTINPAEAIEWFLHTDWWNASLELPYHLDKIEEYGEDAVAQAQSFIGITQIMYLLFMLMFMGMNIMIIGYAASKAIKSFNQRGDETSAIEGIATIMVATLAAFVYLSINLVFFNKAIDEVLAISDDLAGTSVSINETHIEYIYGQIVDFRYANTERDDDTLLDNTAKDVNDEIL